MIKWQAERGSSGAASVTPAFVTCTEADTTCPFVVASTDTISLSPTAHVGTRDLMSIQLSSVTVTEPLSCAATSQDLALGDEFVVLEELVLLDMVLLEELVLLDIKRSWVRASTFWKRLLSSFSPSAVLR